MAAALPTGRCKYAEELVATARAIGAAGKGVLAADESTGTIGKRFAAIGLENNQANRRAYRQLLATTPGLSDHISGVILYEETLFEKAEDGVTDMRDLFRRNGMILGIKSDLGTAAIAGTDGETSTQGLDKLAERSAKWYEAGARFCKWRNVIKISASCPSPLAIQDCATTLARYASISQSAGLAPIVEPEILMDGDHSQEVCQYWTEKVLAACYKALSDHHVLLEGTLLKPAMVLQGEAHGRKASPEEVARATLTALLRTVPAAVPTICFLSGGQGEEEATVNLNAINSVPMPRPWSLTFSYGRALQQTCIATWKGQAANVKAAQEALLLRARANGDAQRGKYTGFASGAGGESLYQKNYTY